MMAGGPTTGQPHPDPANCISPELANRKAKEAKDIFGGVARGEESVEWGSVEGRNH